MSGRSISFGSEYKTRKEVNLNFRCVMHRYVSRLELRTRTYASACQCSLLKSVQPTNFHADQGALEEFTRHLKPLLVDLFEEREGICQRRLGDSEFDPNTPDLDLTIGSWPLGDEDEADAPSRGYLLMHHELLSDHTH